MSDTDWKKKCQELENEMILIKGITVHNSPEMREMKTKLSETEVVLNGTKKIVREMHQENADMYKRIEELCGVNESHQKFNGKLQTRLTELEQENIELHADNKKLAKQIDDQVNRLRKAGVL
jgi:predicted HicB family RNase H-like nuclease|tara:strand:+ start:342 stop:707 length:366 start_codon:yes stop_codon:yes gene_type:complete